MAHLMKAPGLAQEQNSGGRRNAAEDSDTVLTVDHAEGSDLPVEGDRLVEV
jgi:hypothetical protein